MYSAAHNASHSYQPVWSTLKNKLVSPKQLFYTWSSCFYQDILFASSCAKMMYAFVVLSPNLLIYYSSTVFLLIAAINFFYNCLKISFRYSQILKDIFFCFYVCVSLCVWLWATCQIIKPTKLTFWSMRTWVKTSLYFCHVPNCVMCWEKAYSTYICSLNLSTIFTKCALQNEVICKIVDFI